MGFLLSTEDAATLAAARTVLNTLAHDAGRDALKALYVDGAEPNAVDLGRVSESAKHAKDALTAALITAKVYGESAEAGAVL